MSLLTDHALLLHPEQKALLKHKLPACTVGSLREQIRFDAIIKFISQIIDSEDPAAQLSECVEQIKKVVVIAPPENISIMGFREANYHFSRWHIMRIINPAVISLKYHVKDQVPL